MISRSLLLFSISGLLGFIVDSGVLYLLKDYCGLYVSRAVSFFLAVITTWLINRFFTFRGKTSKLPVAIEFFHYLVAMLFGGIVNYLSYTLAINLSDIVKSNPVFGVAIGSLVGMLLNWLSTSKLIFRDKKN